MALVNGNNKSGKMFDVIDEDGDVIASFDEIDNALDCGHSAPWWAGCVNIRRDRMLNELRHKRLQELARLDRLAFDYAV